MHVISFAAQKGGVGKTTLAVNLAVGTQLAGVKTALFDMDPQESATAWSERRSVELPHVEPMSARRIRQAIDAAKANGFDLVILDTPPAAGVEAATAVEVSNLVLVPCGASLIDLDAIARTAQLIASIDMPGFAVLNSVPPTATALVVDARMLIEKTGLKMAPVVLRQRSAFRASWAYGQGVTEYERKGKAAEELAGLQTFVLKILQN